MQCPLTLVVVSDIAFHLDPLRLQVLSLLSLSTWDQEKSWELGNAVVLVQIV